LTKFNNKNETLFTFAIMVMILYLPWQVGRIP